MKNKLKKCPECKEVFVWDDMVVKVDDEDIYHEYCLELYPNGYTAFDLDGNPIGEVEGTGYNPDDLLDEGEYYEFGDRGE